MNQGVFLETQKREPNSSFRNPSTGILMNGVLIEKPAALAKFLQGDSYSHIYAGWIPKDADCAHHHAMLYAGHLYAVYHGSSVCGKLA